MGGGSVWKGVARVVTPAVRVVGTSASTSSSCSFCKTVSTASSHAAKPQSARLRSCACNTGGSGNQMAAAASSISQQGPTLWDLDEWEFAEEEEKIDHLVFGSLPSRTEIEEASSELQNALRLGLVAPAASDNSRALFTAPGGESGPPVNSSVMGLEAEGKDGSQVSSVNSNKLLASQLAIDWVEPPPIRSSGQQGVLQPAGQRDNVVDAFRQFQHNPEVQNMVVSLAADPAVWDAVMANEKIQEFKRKLAKDKSIILQGDSESIFADVKDGDVKIEDEESSPNIFTRLQSFWQKRWSVFVGVLSSIIDGLFNVGDKKLFSEEDGDFLDKTVKSCTMLALIVLSVVILKRLAVQAA
jgi:hypothetical protein